MGIAPQLPPQTQQQICRQGDRNDFRSCGDRLTLLPEEPSALPWEAWQGVVEGFSAAVGLWQRRA